MSEDQLKAFIAKVQADTSLQEQLKAEGADVVAIAKAAGFTITTEDLNSQSQDLSDEELESASGGIFLTMSPFKIGRCGPNYTGRSGPLKNIRLC
ncbi:MULTISPECIES: Nif11-like leader peptide family natural product precursor [unclassified Prochlorococcus]|uniref:Nif11-like leader peptide family natural product precursor n=1 Tax=unclassified Prochlorococcus TaxID=2627481 RepID=UPI000533BAFB|nr:MULTISPECIES: Nif11-like leader peptide family natural product precursor [unclassified Prochlorococcus]KGG27784.1 hypothetical protein EV13_1903 [Prochlorococcus sp. MIT 0702]KGG29659.1 hypothetical protein EV12_0070 [Prochlorococcus sp. MIT 0701]KGG34339.1 hypothetical protein EV14_1233 [Prochlorococcus sp. MIT 0703]